MWNFNQQRKNKRNKRNYEFLSLSLYNSLNLVQSGNNDKIYCCCRCFYVNLVFFSCVYVCVDRVIYTSQRRFYRWKARTQNITVKMVYFLSNAKWNDECKTKQQQKRILCIKIPLWEAFQCSVFILFYSLRSSYSCLPFVRFSFNLCADLYHDKHIF